MPRKKAADQDTLLAYPVRTRVTKDAWARLEKIKTESGCQTVGEVARMVLSDEPIKCFYVDTSLSGPMEQLALIRKELKAIGININQQTRFFHQSRSDAHRGFYVMKTVELYKQVDEKTDELLKIVSRLAARWLQGS